MTRFMLYSHDTYGLGHLRRSTLLAAAITEASEDNEVLIVTGSPHAQTFPLPERVDSLKLPSATKDGAGAYQPRRLGGSIRRLVAIRSALVVTAARTYAPDVILVDHAPLGMAGELQPLLDQCARLANGPRLVLGLRDIVDDAARVDQDWERSGIWSWLDHYDDIFVYGDRRILTTADELDLDTAVPSKVTHTGYVAPRMSKPASTDALASALGPARSLADEPFLLVTPGGGGDGQKMLRRFLDAVEAGATGDMRSLIVTGPLMSSNRRSELLGRALRSPGVEIIDFSDQMRMLVASAAGVVSMAGYNTVVEELAANVPGLLVPRRHPRLEQDIRARRMAVHTRLDRCALENLDARSVERFVERASDASSTPALDIDLQGASTAAALLGATTPTRTHHCRNDQAPELNHVNV